MLRIVRGIWQGKGYWDQGGVGSGEEVVEVGTKNIRSTVYSISWLPFLPALFVRLSIIAPASVHVMDSVLALPSSLTRRFTRPRTDLMQDAAPWPSLNYSFQSCRPLAFNNLSTGQLPPIRLRPCTYAPKTWRRRWLLLLHLLFDSENSPPTSCNLIQSLDRPRHYQLIDLILSWQARSWRC